MAGKEQLYEPNTTDHDVVRKELMDKRPRIVNSLAVLALPIDHPLAMHDGFELLTPHETHFPILLKWKFDLR